MKRIFRKTFRTITKTCFAFNKNLFKLLAQSVLIPLELSVAASAIDCSYEKETFWIRYININNFLWGKND